MSIPNRSAAWRAAVVLLVSATALPAQGPASTGAATELTLADALSQATEVSPSLSAAREELRAAEGRARQASAFANPAFSFQREQTSRTGLGNSQNIITLDQPIELGLRAARRDAAGLRREAAVARLREAEAQLAFEVTRAFARVHAADRRAELASESAAAFARAQRVSDERLAAGDISGYANRRLKLEAARYAASRAEAILAQRAARLELLALIAPADDRRDAGAVRVAALTPPSGAIAEADSLLALALANRGDLAAARLDAEAARADAMLATRERIPTPVITAGVKTEEISGVGDLSGFAAGVVLPLPLWDRRRGAVDAAVATGRVREAEVAQLRRRVELEVREAVAAARTVDEQVAALAGSLGAESVLALRAAEVAYAEGEIPLIEWLDAVRAYQEAEASLASLRAESHIRRAALDRAVGLPLRRSVQ
jgi:outer membrane protein, heavy metal efflux system